MQNLLFPSLWIITVIAGLPHITETIYTPSLPHIALDFNVTDALVEYTLTVYLAFFAIGTLFWGNLSDKIGRKPSLIIALCFFIIGCVGCFFSDSIEMLMASRALQAFGGSAGNILSQVISRDTFKGESLGKVYSTTGSILSLSLAIGPLIGGAVDEFLGWPYVFVFLFALGIMTLIAVVFKLPETHDPHDLMYQTPYPVMQVLKNIITDPKVLSFALIIAGCNGIQFSYYAEGPFYLIGLLGLTPFLYGLSFIFIALAGVLGGWISRSLQGKVMPYDILIGGITTTLIGSLIFVGSVYLKDVLDLSNSWLSVATLSCMTIIVTGMSIALPNCHSLSLRDYQYAVGSASSIFGFLYYCLISLFTFFMGWMHNNTLYPMPLYFLSISLFLLIMSYSIKRSEQP